VAANDPFSVIVVGAKQVAGEFTRAAQKADAQVYATTRMYTQLLTTSVKRHASGRPGPNAPTGDYRRSITGNVERHAGTVIGIVGTDRPQGRRLELGFVGRDALGRYYRQGPLPHFSPAFDEISQAYTRSMGGVVKRLL
jgi:hypothetical protein